MRVFSLLTALSLVTTSLASQIPNLSNLESLRNVKSTKELLGHDIAQLVRSKGYLYDYKTDDSPLRTLFRVGNLIECAEIFASNSTEFIANLSEIRKILNNNTFYTALLFQFLITCQTSPDFKRVIMLFCKLLKDNPDSVSPFEFLKLKDTSLLATICSISLNFQNFDLIKKLTDLELFDINRCVSTADGYVGNGVVYIRSKEAFQFAIEMGVDLNKLIMDPAKKQITSLYYLRLRFPSDFNEMIRFALENYQFSENVLIRANAEFADLNLCFCYLPNAGDERKAVLCKV